MNLVNYIGTRRGTMAYRTWGDSAKPVVLLIHGNAVHSEIWTFAKDAFPADYFYVCPDLRGYGKSDSSQFINSTNGVFDWVFDLNELVFALNLKEIHVVGHSLGGNIAWGLLAENYEWIKSITFISTGSPFGFGGTKNAQGEWVNSDVSGTGAGMVHPKFVSYLKQKDLGDTELVLSPLNVFNRLFCVKNEALIKQVCELSFEMHLGENAYPGDSERSTFWPFVRPGKTGPVNALSPRYQNGLVDALKKPNRNIPILWIYGKQDEIVSDKSYADAGFLGKTKVIPNWPGEEIYPIQPMLQQIRALLSLKSEQGTLVKEIAIEQCGHFPFLEQEKVFNDTLSEWLISFKTKNSLILID